MVEWLRDTEWHQGTMIPLSECVLFKNNPDGEIAVAISHDCDIANSINNEPVIEFLIGKFVEEINPNYKYAKNCRKLHISVKDCNDSDRILELIHHAKISISKDLLHDINPSDELKLQDINTFQSWLASRYKRHGFPDSFVMRMSPVFDYLERKGKKYASQVLGYFLNYDPIGQELGIDDPYEVSIFIVYSIDTSDGEVAANDIAFELDKKFDELCSKSKQYGVMVKGNVKAYSEEEFTMRDLRQNIEYKMEYLTNRIES